MQQPNIPDEKRRFERFQNASNGTESSPVLIYTNPPLADGAIVPKDFSTGGFCLNLPTSPQVETEVECTIKIREISLEGLKARVAWVSEVKAYPPSWNVGLAVSVSGGEREMLASLLTAILTDAGPSD